jgi:hypothetical protein
MPLNQFYGPRYPILGAGFLTQRGGASAHRCIAHCGLNNRRQFFGGEALNARQTRANAELYHTLRPTGLVTGKGRDEAGHARPQTRARSASTAAMCGKSQACGTLSTENTLVGKAL